MHEFLRIRGLFSFLFFVAAGLLFDVDFFRQHWSTILLVVCLLAVGKGLILWLTTYLVDLRGELPRVAALGLFQIGELAVVLAWLGWKSEALTADIYALLIAVILPLMILTPLALRLTPALFKTSSIAPK